jgi:D-alanyl-D-alanine carboxypeptidase
VAAFTPDRFHETTTIARTRLDRSPRVGLTERSELEAVGSRAAWRVPHLRWQCESVPSTSLNSELLALELKPRSARIVGATTVAAAPATRINVQGTLYTWTGNQIDAVEVDVSQATGLPLRITATVRTRLNGKPATQTLTETYARYGATVKVTVPKACR